MCLYSEEVAKDHSYKSQYDNHGTQTKISHWDKLIILTLWRFSYELK